MILVTGGTGMVGGHLLLKLAQGPVPVRALYRTRQNIEKTRKLFAYFGKQEAFTTIQWVEGDINNIPSLEDAFTRITHVYHCAANVSFDPADEESLRKVNIEGTANMVNCALNAGIEKFCHVSSVAALGDPIIANGIVTEETEWNPEIYHSDYQITKYGAEMEVWRGWQEGLKVVIVNPGLIFGYGYWKQGSSAVLKSVSRGQYFYTTGTCGIVAVEDVTNIMVQLMDSDINGERYIVVADNINLHTMLSVIAAGMGKHGPVIYATKPMMATGWRIDWLLSKLLMRKRMLTRHMAKTAYKTEHLDNTKIKKALNYSFIDMQPYLKEVAGEYIKQKG
ncbi:NAD-dependent epimerase/dehydratase family protein [Flavobacterium rhizosphaerae]|uniref:NAD-dependent epimerase/dehydratase family protein n=1 Tax=Flavobacterium rhizosphaerae TaxID=3163298 RepID=A0ABW8YX94_9FLAO